MLFLHLSVLLLNLLYKRFNNEVLFNLVTIDQSPDNLKKKVRTKTLLIYFLRYKSVALDILKLSIVLT